VFTPGMWGAGRIADLSFHLDYDHNLWEQATVLVNRLGAGKPSFLGAGWFYALLIIVYLALLYLLLLYHPTDQEEHADE
jgi:hypothetical protein